jgi:hypothetical protein
LNKAENIYWTNARTSTTPRRTTRRKKAVPATRGRSPYWLSLMIVGAIFSMLCISINLKAFSSMRSETEQNTRLSVEIQNLIDENLVLQEEIHLLKTDPKVIQREAEKIGVTLAQEKFPVQTK